MTALYIEDILLHLTQVKSRFIIEKKFENKSIPNLNLSIFHNNIS